VTAGSEGRARARVFVETGRSRVPVLVRDGRLRVVHTGTSGSSFFVAPGRYVVAVALPGDRLIEEIIDVGPGESRAVAMADAIDDADARLGLSDRVGLVSAGRSPLPPGWQVARRLETFLPATLVRRRPVLVGRSLRTDRFSRTEVLAPGVAFMEISDGGTSVALGLPADHISLIIQDTGQADLALAAFPPGPEAQLMLRYLAANDLERGALLLPDLVRPTRFERIADEALLLGGYLAVRLGGSAPLPLPRDALWLADTLAIAAEAAAAAGSHGEAAECLVELGMSGIPRFTAGFSILVSRLRQYTREGPARVSLTGGQRREIDQLHEAYGGVVPYVDLTRPTTTFRNLPGLVAA